MIETASDSDLWNTSKDRHHEIPGRVVVVVEQHLVELRTLELSLALALGDDLGVRIHGLGHRRTF